MNSSNPYVSLMSSILHSFEARGETPTIARFIAVAFASSNRRSRTFTISMNDHIPRFSAEEAQRIALMALRGEYDLLLACRDLADGKDQLTGVSDEVMDIFVGVAAQLDELPLGPERQYWAPEALKLKDREAMEFRERIRERVRQALERFLLALAVDRGLN